ncbi:hypothetical protein JCM5350_000224, partial [Sporobolomyces pararoseus]
SAISQVYDGSTSNSYPPESSSSSPAATMDEALLPSSTTPLNESFDGPSQRRRRTSTNGLGTGVVGLYYLRQALAVPIHILSWPLSIVYNLSIVVLGFIARLLGFRISTSTFHPRNPFSSTTSPSGGVNSNGFNLFRSNRRPRTILSPTAASREWVESVQRLVNFKNSLPPLVQSTGIQVGTSSTTGNNLSRRNVASGEIELPEFFTGGYEQALRKVRDEFKILMVILTCQENERDEEFKRKVLTDFELIKSLKDENVVVWGGDVMERDAYQVGRTLSYTSLPFVAFIALQPSNSNPSSSSSVSSSSPRLSLISRVEPISPSLPTISASHLHTHLHSTVLPKTSPYLSRLKLEKERRESERRSREAREKRVEEIARKDEERILGIRKALEIKKREELIRIERLEREKKAFEEKLRRARLARNWRETKRREFDQDRIDDEEEGIRLVVRLGNGKRVLRKFGKNDRVGKVYEWVECELGREEDEEDNDDGGIEGLEDDEAKRYVQKFAFKLATTFPRQVIQLPRSMFETSPVGAASFDSLEDSTSGEGEERVLTVGEAFEGMGKDVSLVVDGLEERRRMSMSSRDDDEDDDDEEEEEEEED